MHSFIVKRKPLSHQSHGSKTRKNYQLELAAIFDNIGFNDVPMTGSLYARIYYFHAGRNEHDADNISKPIVDALKGHAYHDDDIVVHRTAAIVDMRKIRTEDLS